MREAELAVSDHKMTYDASHEHDWLTGAHAFQCACGAWETEQAATPTPLLAVVERLVKRTPFMPAPGGITAHLSFDQMDEARAALAATPAPLDGHQTPGEFHDYRVACVKCGEPGFLHVSWRPETYEEGES